MANQPIPGGTWGRISTKKQPDGIWRANARYKSKAGKILQRERFGSTSRKAENALLELFLEMREKDDAPLGADSLFSTVVEEWIAYAEAGGASLRTSTVYEYARIARRDIIPVLGHMPLIDVNVKACADHLHGIIKDGRGHAKADQNRSVLSNILKWAAGRGLIAVNPVRQVAALPGPRKKPVQIIEREDVQPLLLAVRRHAESPPEKSGPKPNFDIADGLELFLATGARISELLGLRWEDLVIDGPGPYALIIRGKVGWEQGKGIVWHDYTKASDEERLLPLGSTAAAAMRSRRARENRANPLQAVFPSRNGRWLHPANWRRRWRTVREELGLDFEISEDLDLAAITPHTFRRTVGTHIAEGGSLEAAARQLGHARTATTVQGYVKARREAPDSTAILEGMMYRH
ncbi:tyrosine-type recombinase/integrase [Arthrobacter sulfonylureivorans]|uniref:tyrosine-type recombinase/integrase n=1 Tax=Arthrobacter sulfonylureivorans TaxID=2486855 RepID=UPI0039E4503D